MVSLNIVGDILKLIKITILFFCIFFLAISIDLKADPSIIKDLRIGDHPTYTRLVFDIDEKVDYRVFLLAEPNRLVIDLPDMKWKVKRKKANDIFKGAIGFIKNYRFGHFTNKQFRIVFDLNAPVKIKKLFMIKKKNGKPYRLVIDLQKTFQNQFVKTVGINKAIGTMVGKPIIQNDPVPQVRYSQKDRQKPLIVIDPGHGGVDPGAIGITGLKEKDVVLAFSKLLAKKLKATGRYRVHMTRSTDVYLKLRQRVRIAQKMGASFFLSIHADAAPNRMARGLTIYTLSEKASDKEAAALAKKENRSDAIAGVIDEGEPVMVKEILLNIAQRDTQNESKKYANIALKDLKRVVRLKRPKPASAGFAVLKAPAIPSVLVELAYLSNRKDEKLLRYKSYHEKVAKAILKSLDRYFYKK